MTAFEIAMDQARLAQTNDPDTSEGIAWIFEDTPESKTVAVTTVSFARKFCEQDPYYTWRKL